MLDVAKGRWVAKPAEGQSAIPLDFFGVQPLRRFASAEKFISEPENDSYREVECGKSQSCAG